MVKYFILQKQNIKYFNKERVLVMVKYFILRVCSSQPIYVFFLESSTHLCCRYGVGLRLYSFESIVCMTLKV